MRVGFFRRIYKICWKSEELSGKKPGKNDRIVTKQWVHFPAVKTAKGDFCGRMCERIRGR
jgi:hypothetical protein